MARRSHRDDLPIRAEINVTSLVDVAFTILLIFMIVAPALEGGLEVNLPEADTQPITFEDNPFIINIDEDGTILIGSETRITIESLRDNFPDMVQARSMEIAYVRADSLAPLGTFYRVLGILNDNGVHPALVAEEWAKVGG